MFYLWILAVELLSFNVPTFYFLNLIKTSDNEVDSEHFKITVRRGHGNNLYEKKGLMLVGRSF